MFNYEKPLKVNKMDGHIFGKDHLDKPCEVSKRQLRRMAGKTAAKKK